MLQRPSSLFWWHSVKSLSCLEISSVTLTPMSSPESNLSGGLLTPPPSKPALLPPKPTEGCSIPRPRVNSIFCLSALSTVATPVDLVYLAFLLHWLSLLLHFKKERNRTSLLFVFSWLNFPWLHTQAGSISVKPQSTDIFDMVPFSPVTPLVPTLASNGCPPPPPTTLPPDISE